jgi:hypothetical protein
MEAALRFVEQDLKNFQDSWVREVCKKTWHRQRSPVTALKNCNVLHRADELC